MSYYVLYAGEKSTEHGLLVYQRPDIRVAEENIDDYDIPGRDMNLYDRTGNFEPAKIDVIFNYAATASDWNAVHRDAILWLRKSGNLQFSDDLEWYRKVLYVNLDKNARSLKRVGKFTATFVCKPGIYLLEGADFASASSLADSVSGTTYTIINNYSEARPVYKLTGNGGCTLTVNGNSMVAAVASNLTIDTALKIAYQTAETMTNTAVTGDYDDLVLVSGANTITVTSGFSLEIQTNYRVM